MDRYIENPSGLTWNDLQNNDWDLIKLNITVDTTSAMEWVDVLSTQHRDCIWNFDCFHLVDPEFEDRYKVQRDKILVRTEDSNTEQWALQWSYQREGIIPFMIIACRKQFPEVYEPGFQERWNQNLTKFEFGFWKRYYEALGPEVFRVTRLVKFPQNCGLNVHRDTNRDYLIRMHTVPMIGPDHYFSYADDLENPVFDPKRQYKMEPGCTYLLNTGIPHKAINYDPTPWWMLHNNPTQAGVDMLLNTKLHVK